MALAEIITNQAMIAGPSHLIIHVQMINRPFTVVVEQVVPHQLGNILLMHMIEGKEVATLRV